MRFNGKSLELDGFYTGEVVLCWELVEQTCREHITQANIKPVYYLKYLRNPYHGYQRHETP